MVGPGQNFLPLVTESSVILLRPQDQRHPVMIRRHRLVGRRGEHGIFFDARFLAPKSGQTKRLPVRLPEQDVFLIKSIRQQQTTLVQMRAERRSSMPSVSLLALMSGLLSHGTPQPQRSSRQANPSCSGKMTGPRSVGRISARGTAPNTRIKSRNRSFASIFV